MTKRLLLWLCVTWIPVCAAARSRAVQPPGSFPAPASLMWIAAHPDDEAVVAPLLAFWCRDQRVRCSMVVFTRGEAGQCLRSDGCLPDVASVRSAEAGAASEYFGADSILFRYPDGGGRLPPSWAGGNAPADTIARLSDFIDAVSPDIILTFDPRHGTTCHPDHRAVGNIVLDAAKRARHQAQVYLLETRVTFSADPFAIHFTPADPEALVFDATSTLNFTRGPAWNAVIDDMQRHSSQFDGTFIRAAQNVPSSEHRVYLAPAEATLQRSGESCR